MTQSDTKRDIYQPCEDSPDERSGQAIWPLKNKLKSYEINCWEKVKSYRKQYINGGTGGNSTYKKLAVQ